MIKDSLIGMRVMNRLTNRKGRIVKINGDKVIVSNGIENITYTFPAAFSNILVLEDEELQNELQEHAQEASLEHFINIYSNAVQQEINYLKKTGGKRYRIVDGERIITKKNIYIYSFDTDTEFHFPDGTEIKIWLSGDIINAHVVSCEEFTILIQITLDLGKEIEFAEFTAAPWGLMEPLIERLKEMRYSDSDIAFELISQRKAMVDKKGFIETGQNKAVVKAESQKITFVWGPPGTGKTTTLARIAMEFINRKKRVLMLSYSNVSVDGALLKVASMSENNKGKIIRYGYPRMIELLEHDEFTSYGYVLLNHSDLAEEYYELIEKRKKVRGKNNPQKIEIKKRIQKIRSKLLSEEIKLVHEASFVATTVSKAIIDSAIYEQKFDLVLFDEASMAFVPQVVFAAGLAKESFCCLGDFCQLPAIVQNPEDTFLKRDIFEYAQIVYAVEQDYGHNWLVLLNEQYRMHPEIAGFAGEHMYKNMLLTPSSVFGHRKPIADMEPFSGSSIGMVDLSETYSVCIKTMDGSRINLLSALMSIFIADMYIDQYDVGIITPYSAQARLIFAMIRDLRTIHKKYNRVMAATVHQFQGSEKPVIIYDAVDCYRMPYPGTLLTSKKDNKANRLFNVAITRAQGKFVLIANKDFFIRKKLDKQLMFAKLMREIHSNDSIIKGDDVFDEIGTEEDENTNIFLGDRDEEDSWNRFLKDLNEAKKDIFIEVPGPMDEDEDALMRMITCLKAVEKKGIKILIRFDENTAIPKEFERYSCKKSYVTTPFTIVDKEIIWFGEPLSSADFFSQGNIIITKYFPCMRFKGKNTTRMLRAFYEVPNI